MTLNRLLAASALALSLAAPSAQAETKKELVAKVIQLQQAELEGVGMAVANNTANQVMQTAGRAMGRVPADKREAVGKEVQAEVQKFFDDVAPKLRSAAVALAPAAMGPTYEERLTEDELKTLIAWLESPVKRKVQQLAPEAQQQLLQKLVTETRGQVEPRLKALEQTLAAKLGSPAPAAAPAAKPAPPPKK